MMILFVNDNRFENVALRNQITITDKVPTRKDFYFSDDLVILNTASQRYYNFPEDAELYSLVGFDNNRNLASFERGVILPVVLPSNVHSLEYLKSDTFYQQMLKLNEGRQQLVDLLCDIVTTDEQLDIAQSMSTEDFSVQLQNSDIQELLSDMDIAIDENELYQCVCRAHSAWKNFELLLI